MLLLLWRENWKCYQQFFISMSGFGELMPCHLAFSYAWSSGLALFITSSYITPNDVMIMKYSANSIKGVQRNVNDPTGGVIPCIWGPRKREKLRSKWSIHGPRTEPWSDWPSNSSDTYSSATVYSPAHCAVLKLSGRWSCWILLLGVYYSPFLCYISTCYVSGCIIQGCIGSPVSNPN